MRSQIERELSKARKGRVPVGPQEAMAAIEQMLDADKAQGAWDEELKRRREAWLKVPALIKMSNRSMWLPRPTLEEIGERIAEAISYDDETATIIAGVLNILEREGIVFVMPPQA